jgi:hypothetical protein
MADIGDSSISIIRQIQKYEYAASALYMAAYAAPNNQVKLDLSSRAIDCASNAIQRLDELKQLKQGGDEDAVKRFSWMVEDFAYERTRYFQAIAMSINFVAGGSVTRKDIESVWNKIPDSYKREFPASSNKFLTQALTP